MMKNRKIILSDARIYWVYDRDLSLAYDKDFEILKSLVVTGMIDLLQFRAKGLSFKEYMSWLSGILNKINFQQALLFANDHVPAVGELQLDGVHIGADDMPVREAREYLGPDYLLGATARTEARAISSCQEGADYLGVGTVFQTTTKKGLTAKGPIFIKQIKSMVSIPVFPIGGINSENITQLTGEGIKSAAVASNLLKSEFPEQELRNLFQALK